MSKGYKRKKENITFNFGPNHDLYGLEVTARPATLTAFLEILHLSQDSDKHAFLRVSKLADLLGAELLRWNLIDEDDKPVPCTPEMLRDQDPAFVLGLGTAWIEAVQGVPAPLGRGSSGGDQSLAELPMTEA